MAIEYELQGDYGYGYESILTESSKEEAETRLQEYNENEKGIPHRVVELEV